MLNLFFVNPNSPFSLTLTAYILWLQQSWTAESEVFHTILPNRPQTLLQNPNTTEYHQGKVSFQLVYRIQRFLYIHYEQQTQFEPMYLQLLPLTKVPTRFSVQVLQDSSTHRQLCATPSPLICPNQGHNELPSVELYAGVIIINPFLSIPHMSGPER